MERQWEYLKELSRQAGAKKAEEDAKEAEDKARRKEKEEEQKAKEAAEDKGFQEVKSRRRKKKERAAVKKAQVDGLRVLTTIEPESVKAIGDTEQEWEEIELAVDSAATETVIGEDMLSRVAMKQGPAYKRGVEYEVANGVRIPNLGEKSFRAVSEENVERSITAQVCEVNKALLSVQKVMKAGNRIVFDEEGSYIEDKGTGEIMNLRQENGMFLLKVWVHKDAGF